MPDKFIVKGLRLELAELEAGPPTTRLTSTVGLDEERVGVQAQYNG